MSATLSRLPSLDLVRGFVAVGRRMSITLAAQDLCLTQSAVSRQVQGLEEALGVRLFVRGHRAITFTAEGERLFRMADAAVQQLQDVVGSLLIPRGRRPVTVTCSIGVASLWLLPRLGVFQARWPRIDVRLATSNRVVDLRAEGVDLAVRYCAPAAAPDGAVRLFGETLAPVAHPSLGLARLGSAETLARHVLLEYDDPRRPWLQWTEWLRSAGLGKARPKGMLRFNQYDHVIHAALAGQGIALGRMKLVEPLVAEGRLRALMPSSTPAGVDFAYWLVMAEAEPRDEVRAVARWIRETAAEAGEGAA